MTEPTAAAEPRDARAYVPYSDSVEVVQPNEAEDTAETIAVFDKLRTLTFEKHRHALRDAHAKSHGIVRGTLTVPEGLAPELAQGLFARPGTYDVIARFSTSPGDILADGVAAFRGLALKVLGVDGPKLLPEEADAVTQDFLFFNHPVIPTGDVKSYLAAQKRMEKLAHAPEQLQEALTATARLAGDALRAVGLADPAGVIGQAKPHTHPVGETYYTGAALRHGAYVAKLSVVPASEAARALAGQHVDTGDNFALRDAVVAFFRAQGAEYDVQVQLCTDLETMPVEDGSVRWPEDGAKGGSPYRTVGRLAFPPQEAFSPARRVYADDVLTFTPFHALPAHRPLGSIMRVRRQAYETSSAYRHQMNAQPRAEPRAIDELPN